MDPAATVIAADGGARHAAREHVRVTDVVGDLDTLTPDEVDDFARVGARIHRFDPVKDFTDFELAAQLATAGVTGRRDDPAKACPRLLVVGGEGGRLDHAVGNLMVLTGDDLAPFAVTALVGRAVVQTARVGSSIQPVGQVGDLVSLVPMGGPVHGVRTEGLRYELRGDELSSGRTRGVSNVIVAPRASVCVGSGVLAVIEPDAVAGLIDRYRGGAQ